MSKSSGLFKFNLFWEDKDSSLNKFKEHYEKSSSFVRRLVSYHLDENFVDDVVQNTYLKAWKSFSSFKEESSFNTWVYRITMNCIYDELRKVVKLNNCEQVDQEYNDENINKDLIKKGLYLIDQKDREYFVLYFYFSYSFKEISQITNKPESTVKSKVYKAKETFVKFLEKNGVRHG